MPGLVSMWLIVSVADEEKIPQQLAELNVTSE